MRNDQWRLHGAPNFRDFGGYRGEGGRHVRRGMLFRSGTLSALTERDLECVAALEIRLVCDLRGSEERLHHPTRWPSASKPEVLQLDVNADVRSGDVNILNLLGENPSAGGAEAVMLRIYRNITRGLQGHLEPIFRRLADGEGLPVMIHCTAGKDRTGVLAALILLALGVSRADVFADYRMTEAHTDIKQLRAEIATLMSRVLGVEPQTELVYALAAVRETYLDAALAAIEDGYGSVSGYLDAMGVGMQMVECLRARLLEA